MLVKQPRHDRRRRVAQLAREGVKLVPSVLRHPQRAGLQAHAAAEGGHATGVRSVAASHFLPIMLIVAAC